MKKLIRYSLLIFALPIALIYLGFKNAQDYYEKKRMRAVNKILLNSIEKENEYYKNN